jgi:hypothetical protein
MNKRNWSWRPFFPKSKHFRPLASAFDLLLCPTKVFSVQIWIFFAKKFRVLRRWCKMLGRPSLLRLISFVRLMLNRPLWPNLWEDGIKGNKVSFGSCFILLMRLPCA